MADGLAAVAAGCGVVARAADDGGDAQVFV